MKSKLFVLFMVVALASHHGLVVAQQPVRLVFFNGSYDDGAAVNFPCGATLNFVSYLETFNAATGQYQQGGFINGVNSVPPNWSYTRDRNTGQVTFQTAPGGDGRIELSFAYSLGGSAQTFTLYVKTAPRVSYTVAPALYGSNQSGNYEVDVQGGYTSLSWMSLGGLLVNGSNNYSGGTTATVSTQDFGGSLMVSATNECGTGQTESLVVGPPYISSRLVNGNPAQSSNTVANDALLIVATNGTGSSCSWTNAGGSGNFYPNGFSCNAYPTNFLRVRAQVSNQYGTGESYTFFLFKQGYNGYRMAYPNPAKENVTVDFDYPEIAQDLLRRLDLVDEKGTSVRRFDLDWAKSRNYFAQSKSVSLDVKELPKGTYYLHIQIGDKLNKERIVV